MDMTCQPGPRDQGRSVNEAGQTADPHQPIFIASNEIADGNLTKDSVFVKQQSLPTAASAASLGATEESGSRRLVSDWTRDTVFSPVTEAGYSSDPCGSGNSSMDGGATATVKFSALALANNTLLLPHRSSTEDDEEEDMTRVPVQTINYNPEEPVARHIGQAHSVEESVGKHHRQPQSAIPWQNNNMEMTEAGVEAHEMDISGAKDERPGMDVSRANGQTIMQPSEMDMTRATSKTIMQPSAMDMTRATSKTIIQPIEIDITKATSKTIIQPTEMEITTMGSSKTIMQAPEMDITRATSKTIVQPSEMDITAACKTSGQSDMDMNATAENADRSPQPVAHTDTLREKLEMDRLLREKFPSPAASPDPTTTLGLMPRSSKPLHINDDVTSFVPRGESTRRFNFGANLEPPRPPLVRQFSESPEPTTIIGSMQRKEMCLIHDDVTSFVPTGESTRMINFKVVAPEGASETGLDRKPAPTTVAAAKLANALASPEPTSNFAMIPKYSNLSVNFGGDDLTSFAPRGESTRKIDFSVASGHSAPQVLAPQSGPSRLPDRPTRTNLQDVAVKPLEVAQDPLHVPDQPRPSPQVFDRSPQRINLPESVTLPQKMSEDQSLAFDQPRPSPQAFDRSPQRINLPETVTLPQKLSEDQSLAFDQPRPSPQAIDRSPQKINLAESVTLPQKMSEDQSLASDQPKPSNQSFDRSSPRVNLPESVTLPQMMSEVHSIAPDKPESSSGQLEKSPQIMSEDKSPLRSELLESEREHQSDQSRSMIQPTDQPTQRKILSDQRTGDKVDSNHLTSSVTYQSEEPPESMNDEFSSTAKNQDKVERPHWERSPIRQESHNVSEEAKELSLQDKSQGLDPSLASETAASSQMNLKDQSLNLTNMPVRDECIEEAKQTSVNEATETNEIANATTSTVDSSVVDAGINIRDEAIEAKCPEDENGENMETEASSSNLKRHCEFQPKSPSKKQKKDEILPPPLPLSERVAIRNSQADQNAVENPGAEKENAGILIARPPLTEVATAAAKPRASLAMREFSLYEDLEMRCKKQGDDPKRWSLAKFCEEGKWVAFR